MPEFIPTPERTAPAPHYPGTFTVAALRAALEGLPDETPVYRMGGRGGEINELLGARLSGVRGEWDFLDAEVIGSEQADAARGTVLLLE